MLIKLNRKSIEIAIAITGYTLLVCSPESARSEEATASNVTMRAQPASTPQTDASQKTVVGVSSTAVSGSSALLSYLALGLLLGAVGQTARAVVGIKAEMERAGADGKKWDEWFNAKQLTVSFILGGVAGLAYAVSLMGIPVDKQFITGGLAAGYAGSDFIEGFMRFLGGSTPSTQKGVKLG